jgi:hypothetical protein
MQQEEFLAMLQTITPQEINDIIEAKGKEKKPYCPFMIIHEKIIK